MILSQTFEDKFLPRTSFVQSPEYMPPYIKKKHNVSYKSPCCPIPKPLSWLSNTPISQSPMDFVLVMVKNAQNVGRMATKSPSASKSLATLPLEHQQTQIASTHKPRLSQ